MDVAALLTSLNLAEQKLCYFSISLYIFITRIIIILTLLISNFRTLFMNAGRLVSNVYNCQLLHMCATIQAWRARDLTMSFHGAFPVYTKMLVQFNSSWYITVWTIQFICGLYMHCGKLIYPSGALEFILVLWGLFCSPFSFCLVFCSSLLAFFLGHCISCPSIDLQPLDTFLVSSNLCSIEI